VVESTKLIAGFALRLPSHHAAAVIRAYVEPHASAVLLAAWLSKLRRNNVEVKTSEGLRTGGSCLRNWFVEAHRRSGERRPCQAASTSFSLCLCSIHLDVNSILLSLQEHATLGSKLYTVSSANEQHLAKNVLNRLFEGDTKGKNELVKRFFGNKHPIRQNRLEGDTGENTIPGSENGLTCSLELEDQSLQSGKLGRQANTPNIQGLVEILNTLPPKTSTLAAL
jgi:hypothetical protein